MFGVWSGASRNFYALKNHVVQHIIVVYRYANDHYVPTDCKGI